MERVIADALADQPPNPLVWGYLTAEEFQVIVSDVTTWSLTHFEPVRAWSVAEDLSPVEAQEGYGLVGRLRRMVPSDYKANQSDRALRSMAHPKVRASALWVAHALLCLAHGDVSDQRTGPAPQERQAARILGSDPGGGPGMAG